jgi:adenylosuccinate lyase
MGRYASATKSLTPYFSEYGLIYYRVRVEVEYFIALTGAVPELKKFPNEKIAALRSVYETFNEADATAIKEIEKTTNHDVKAVEYFLKNKFDELSLSDYKEFIHFGLTSQDVNNTAIPLSLKEAMITVLLPAMDTIISLLVKFSGEWKDIAMLARTHGQPASPTRLGKEFDVFVVRLQKQVELLNTIPYSAKFGGATGNFNAHHIAYPEINWGNIC